MSIFTGTHCRWCAKHNWEGGKYQLAGSWFCSKECQDEWAEGQK